MYKNNWQNRRRGRRSHQQNSRLRQHGSDERCNSVAEQSPQDSGPISDDESPSTSSGSAGSSSVPDLPGFYFDPEKKRYFRLLPGHNNCNPLTKESIRQKEMESKRLQLLEEEDKQKKKIARVGFNASSLLQKSKLGFLNVTSYCRLAHELRVSCMQRKKVQIQSSDPSALASDRFNLILGAESYCFRLDLELEAKAKSQSQLLESRVQRNVDRGPKGLLSETRSLRPQKTMTCPANPVLPGGCGKAEENERIQDGKAQSGELLTGLESEATS